MKVHKLMEWIKMAYQLDSSCGRDESYSYNSDTKAVIFAYHMSVLDKIQVLRYLYIKIWRRFHYWGCL